MQILPTKSKGKKSEIIAGKQKTEMNNFELYSKYIKQMQMVYKEMPEKTNNMPGTTNLNDGFLQLFLALSLASLE